MNIAELFVRIRGDTTDLHRKLTDAERGLLRLERSSVRLDGAMKRTGLQTGRLGNQFAGLASQIAGVHPVVGNLAGVLGNFAVGAGLTVGILMGVAAIALVWDKLTEATRKAKEETLKAIEAIDKAAHLKMLGPGGEMVDNASKARKEAARLQAEILKLEKEAAGPDAGFGRKEMLLERINNLYIERQNALNRLAEAESMVSEKVNEAIAKNTEKVKELTFGYNELRNAAEKVNAEILKEKTDWWKSYIDKTNEALSITQQLANAQMAVRPKLVEALQSLAPTTPEFSMLNIGISDSLNDEQKKQREKMGIFIDDANKNAVKISDAIWGSATMFANQIVSALNVGGGGKGSNLGGALGSTAGFALGFAFGGGPVGGAIGATIGNIAGSLFGGLFDSNTKAVNANTAATRANTAAMLLYAPAGFKAESYRYNASDPRPIDALGRTVRWNASRGGANPLLGT